ncbi:MAG: GntR family transcriptional regulator [Armatimonadetes bacterium]|nr:GntR family transcriptional regulator [Armatimonadota bacterium]
MSVIEPFHGTLRVDKNAETPRHTQVRDILRVMVTSGAFAPGDKIPAELQLAGELGVSKMTVNKAVLSLAAEGLLVREVGRGTFVAEPMIPAPQPKSEEVTDAPRKVALSFVEGARDVLGSSYYGEIYRGVMGFFEECGETVETVFSPAAITDYRADADRTYADGRLIFAPRAEAIPLIEEMWTSGEYPLVVIGASWLNLHAPAIDSDNTGGAFTAVRYLVEQGHRRIALLLAEAETANMQDRIAGYRRALAVSGIAPRSEYEVHAELAWKAGAATDQLVGLLNHPTEPVTAIFAAGHYLALEAYNAARIAGKRIPEDVSVLGYDDTTAANLIHPRLTVMRQPLRDMGRRAAERLLHLMNDDTAERDGRMARELLPAELIVRDSVAPPTAAGDN